MVCLFIDRSKHNPHRCTQLRSETKIQFEVNFVKLTRKAAETRLTKTIATLLFFNFTAVSFQVSLLFSYFYFV